MSDNTDEPFEREPEKHTPPHWHKGENMVYMRSRRKQRVFPLDGSNSEINNLNALLDKGWRIVQQLEPDIGVGGSGGRSLYLLELEVE